ncbi:MAG: bile acid:sodium symporter family protein [Candidatus Marinimicrobia bacterium]|nr:bile acid:sodium symporter family protein [Candidatus Neomarinimicrobiota bacterium]
MLIDIILPLSLVFIMFSLGLSLTTQDFKNVAIQPKVFAVGVINQMVLLPIVAFGIIVLFGFGKEMAVGLMILACSPGGVTSNILTKLAKGDTALSISYTAVVSIFTVITLPLITGFSIHYFMGSEAPEINVLTLGLTMFFITAIPVSIGLYLHHKAENFTKSFEPRANKISALLFVVIVLGALASEWETFINNVTVLGPGIVTLIIIMLFLGYGSAHLFKMSEAQSVSVAIATGIQNATVGITVGNLILPSGEGLSLLSLPSGVYGILMYLVCLPIVFAYVKWIRSRLTAA